MERAGRAANRLPRTDGVGRADVPRRSGLNLGAGEGAAGTPPPPPPARRPPPRRFVAEGAHAIPTSPPLWLMSAPVIDGTAGREAVAGGRRISVCLAGQLPIIAILFARAACYVGCSSSPRG